MKTNIWLPQSRAEVFEFFAQPGNLDRLTPPWLKFAILMPPTKPISQDAVLNYRLRIRGIPIRWRSEIVLWEPPHRFVDRQTKGPYSLWVHEHTFEDRNNGTLVGDHVEYAVPGGWLVQKYLVAPDLERIFQYRHRALKGIFDPASQAAAP